MSRSLPGLEAPSAYWRVAIAALRPVSQILGFRVWGFRVWGFRVWGFRVWGFRVWGFRVWGCSNLSNPEPSLVEVLYTGLPTMRKSAAIVYASEVS